MSFRALNAVRHETGFCWMADLDDDIVCGDTLGRATSVLRLFENELELGPSHSSHDFIRFRGAGAFSHWERVLFFSASDNSDPASNGRTYSIEAPLANNPLTIDSSFDRKCSALPINYRAPVRTNSEIESDAEYCVECARSYVAALPHGKSDLFDKAVLEIGPGPNFATALILKCWGAAKVSVSDRFLVQFDRDYHRALYREVAKRLVSEDRNTNVTPLETCARFGHIRRQVSYHELPLEELSKEFTSFFNITLSNAVLEHLYRPKQAIATLYAITAPGGIGLHQVDFRDHRDFNQPLEYLLLDEVNFARLFEYSHGECGNRIRPYQMEEMFREAGFTEVSFEVNLDVSPEYLIHFLPRLRSANSVSFSSLPEEYLTAIGGRFVVRR